jgi:electron transfer flavoprotein beta subunit
LAGALSKEKVDLVFSGKEAIDDGAAQTSQLVAEFMNIPVVTVVLGAEYGAGTVKCKREIEGGAYEMIEAPIPVVIAAQKGLNEPRYASLPNIMKAKKKEVKVLKAADVGVADSDQKIRLKNFQLPAPKQAGKKIAGDPAAQAKELVRLLHEEAKVV